jgi:hypothetical protein
VILLALIAAVGAYLAVTKVLDKPAPTEAEVAAAFVPLTGFEYVAMPPETLAPLEAAFAQQTDDTNMVAHFDARQVSENGAPIAVVFILSVDPDAMEGDFQDQYVTGFTATSQATVEDIDIGDTAGHIAETPMGTVAFFFDVDGLAINVVGRDAPTVQQIAGALEAGNS